MYTESQAVYLPAYVFEFAHAGLRLRMLVNGVNGAVGGERVYSPLTAATMASLGTAFAASILADLFAFPLHDSPAVLACVGIPMLAAFIARFYPHLAKLRHDMQRTIEQQRQLLEVLRLDQVVTKKNHCAHVFRAHLPIWSRRRLCIVLPEWKNG
jgi:hypothetical protein